MSRSFNGSNTYLGAGNPSLGLTTTYTVSSLVRPTTAAQGTVIAWRSTSVQAPIYILLDVLGDGSARMVMRGDSATLAAASKASAYSAGVAVHLAGTRSGNTVQVYVDGIAGTSATAAVGSITVNSLDIGANVAGTTTRAAYWTGDIAEVAIWSVELTSTEIASLAKGISPRLIRPQSLVFYAPLIRNVQDVRGGLSITDTGPSTVGVHPRIYK